ncbi:MAG: putative toxin-antitoxin system toxin component, PIN family [Candidatus Accumulibacter necessarius]|uniref:putative toxin-antitoxin system toxin component, PIN family n=1 Tax=Candidatus Accumulibacter necessarius TaxID=2954386 RepID=UPI002FC359B3
MADFFEGVVVGMRLILDTNILVAALITRGTPPDKRYEAWRDGRFTLLTSDLQIEEIRRVTRREGIRFRIHQAEAGRLVNDLRRLATRIENLPTLDVSPDPYDNFLLAMAQAGQTDLLVAGDKDLLSLSSHQGSRILTAREALGLLGG